MAASNVLAGLFNPARAGRFTRHCAVADLTAPRVTQAQKAEIERLAAETGANVKVREGRTATQIVVKPSRFSRNGKEVDAFLGAAGIQPPRVGRANIPDRLVVGYIGE